MEGGGKERETQAKREKGTKQGDKGNLGRVREGNREEGKIGREEKRGKKRTCNGERQRDGKTKVSSHACGRLSTLSMSLNSWELWFVGRVEEDRTSRGHKWRVRWLL